jgi:hypothetical protein
VTQLGSLAGSAVSITLRNVTYVLSKLNAKHHGEIEQHIASMRVDPLDLAIRKIQAHDLKGEQAEFLLGKAWDEAARVSKVTPREISEFLGGLPGVSYVFWMAVREHQPSLTLEHITDLVMSLSEEEIQTAQLKLDQASGHDPNVDGRKSSSTTPLPAEPMTTTGPSTGPESLQP